MSVTIIGDKELIAKLQRYQQIENEVCIPAMRDWAEAARQAMIKRQHYRSGRMRSMTKINPLGRYWSVIIDVPYAMQENERPGKKRGKKGGGQGTPHRFVEPALKEVQKEQLSKFQMRVKQFINTH